MKIKKINFNSNKIRRIITAIVIAILIEIFICNYPALRTIFIGNRDIYKEFKFEDNTITISDINTRVTSVKINYKNKLEDKITYNLKYTAEENSDLISLKPKVILQNSSQYINFDTHSNCKTIQINLETENKIDIENIILNHINFEINILRIFIIFLIIIFILCIKEKNLYKVKYDENSKVQNYTFILNLIVFLCFVAIYTICQFDFPTLLVKPEEINKEDSILMQTEAFVNGSIPLLEEPDEKLKNMENPYDNVKRSDENINYLYDVAYYNGHYYNYFGIAPIITSLLPFRLITGMYFHTYIFNFIYIFGIAISLYFLYKKLITKFVKNISLLNFYLGYYAILFGANILTLLRGAKYDIVVSSGIMFLIISINLSLSIYNNPKYKYVKLILLGISTALIVLSKPNLIVYYLIILILVLKSMKNISVKEKIKDSIWIAVPLGIFAIFQMIFNYLRFDSILEFGAKYQLTSFNMIYCMKMSFGKIYAGIMEYIFRIPMINPLEFPFVFINTNTSLVSVNEVCYENRLIGLIAIPIMWIYIFSNNILKNEKDSELKVFIKICVIASVISIILNSFFGGIAEVYAIDFKLILSICAVILLLKLVDNNNEMFNKLFLVICLATIFIMIPISFTTELNFLSNLRSDITVFLKNMFEFWS